jgi:hypothetical protein
MGAACELGRYSGGLGRRHAGTRRPHVPARDFTKLYLRDTDKKTPAPSLPLTGTTA